MKNKLALLTLLAVMSSHVAAEWAQVGDNADTTFYADTASIKNQGKTVKMWVLADLKAPSVNADGKKTQSVKMFKEFDCAQNLQRVLNMVGYSEKKGKGSVTERLDQTSPYFPASNDIKDHSIACAKR